MAAAAVVVVCLLFFFLVVIVSVLVFVFVLVSLLIVLVLLVLAGFSITYLRGLNPKSMDRLRRVFGCITQQIGPKRESS